MAYQTGSAVADVIALLDLLRVFCVANGFTEHRWQSTGFTDGGTQLILSKNGIYYCLWTDIYSGTSSIGVGGQYCIFSKLATGYAAGQSPWMQPGTWAETLNDRWNGTVCNAVGNLGVEVYHFFLTGTELTVVFKNSYGWWRSFGFGEVGQKLTTFTGGAYTMGNYHSQYYSYMANGDSNFYLFDKSNGNFAVPANSGGVLRADLDNGANPQYHHGGYSAYLGAALAADPVGGDIAIGNVAKLHNLRWPYFCQEGLKLDRGANKYGLYNFLQPVNIWIRRSGDNVFPIARMSSVQMLNIEMVGEGEETVIGADTWVNFPLMYRDPQKTLTTGNVTSWYYGIMVKKVV